ncbi:uncharacterized protein CTRU02_204543 [Colletotrichum truncatum]|uniref:Uncharacterized protein n=1 Tax=Colletotrichum truncatum TaxID=5467 RepID=A0ACC3ZCD1_COLTU|nr:uncharacterized protein CTRU02_02772 [Colletotrichum truncatum]KAF6797730.1 hypothetical protein CTRU02_02772 [Colletotrichum truncatum]
MSRRPPNPAAERAAQNQQTIKSLLKLECNKVCSDCKRNKHPRWASWNLGVFICIRCSGIHRGMGTHISRVKSVDLDSWTDEQLQSILSWGNARANKYWEAKLAPGHVPSESKIENFIRTKYELKRWTMDGPIPDPATLDADGDDDVPLSLVREKQNVERRESVRKSSVGKSAAPPKSIAAPQPQADLIGGDPIPRASTAGPQPGKVPPKSDPAPPKATSTKDSLLGLDFFGEPAAPPRPASTNAAGAMGGNSRPDLKQSILSLYASAPRPQPQQQQQAPQVPGGSFGSMPSPTFGHQQQQSFGGMTDAFSNLGFSNTTSPKPAQADPFASLASPIGNKSPPLGSSNAFGGLGGGSFFDSKPAPAPAAQHQKQPSNSAFGGFGWSSSPAPAPVQSQPKPAQPASSSMGDLFDLSSPSQPAAAPSNPSPAAASSSVFNLSSNQPKSPPAVTNPTAAATSTINSGNWANSDVWGSNAWSTPDTSTSAAAPAPPKVAEAPKPSGGFGGSTDLGGWGSSGSFANTPIVPGASGGFSAAPKVAADEEFGGWTSSTGPTTGSGSAKPAGGNDDLFSNVWQ